MDKPIPWQDQFAEALLADALFYDPDTAMLGNLSLIDPESREERYTASFLPEQEIFVIERAVAWQDHDPDDDPELVFADEAERHGTYDSARQVAKELLALARAQQLLPHLGLLEIVEY